MDGFLPALFGGVLIGLAATLLLVANGRTAGISGITAGLVTPAAGDAGWRAAFLSGLGMGGVLLASLLPRAFGTGEGGPASPAVALVAGLLVGFGTRLGGGCTSGHGICGISRGAVRSVVATAVFMATGVATVLAMRLVQGGSGP